MRETTDVHDVYRLLVGRDPYAAEVADAERAVVARLLLSPEFLGIRDAWAQSRGPYPDASATEASLQAIGPDAQFVRRAYSCLLSRAPDPDGLRHYMAALASGDQRASIVRALATSEEFEKRLRHLAAEAGQVFTDAQLCELANPAKWDNPEWVAILRTLGLSDNKLQMHRKPYELAQLVFGCRRLGVLGENSRIVSVGAGHEPVLYWLANHVKRVVATDLYEGVWQSTQGREGNPDVLACPEQYAPFPYRRDHLGFLRMDGRRLAFRSGTFDVAYSLSSIEHFGGMTGAGETLREMARVLRPGGVLAFATEYVLDGPSHEETFQPAEVAELVAQTGLELVEPIDDGVYRRYEFDAVDLHATPYKTPHMVVRFGNTIFTTVMVFLRKV